MRNSNTHKPVPKHRGKTSETDVIDKAVGSKVRGLRLRHDMSQGQLAAALGLTFQQVQKYESGTNRISASRLVQISRTLNVPVGYFFEGIKQGGEPIPELITDRDSTVC